MPGPAMASPQPVLESSLPGLKLWRKGKVREVYDLGDHLLLVASDRISAFDCILPTAIPGKGEMLTRLSAFWFGRMEGITPHHLVSTEVPADLKAHRAALEGRTMLALKTDPVPFECVVRGYLAGSGWKDYQSTGQVCGIALPPGMQECDRLPSPVFTPSTKAQSGHDENISFKETWLFSFIFRVLCFSANYPFYISRFFTLRAFSSINCLLGSTSSPISTVNISSALTASSTWT